MNNNKNRKGRPSSIRTDISNASGSRPLPQRGGRSSDGFEGVYQNVRFFNTIASLIGNSVQVHLLNGKIIEGIFTTFSPNFEVVLELAHEVDPEHPDRINVKTIEENLVFELRLIVTMTSKDIELDNSVKDTFRTDSSINRTNGLMKEKELEPWDGGNADEVDLSLESDANGWNANEMFKCNEQMYNVQTTFEEDLSQYTTKLQKKDTREYRELEERALRLASSIESNVTSRMQVELENDSDEEEKFAAVVRSENRDFRDLRDSKSYERAAPLLTGSAGRYIPPAKRKGAPAMGRVVRSTPPPHAPRHQEQSAGPGAYHSAHPETDGAARRSHMSSGPSQSYASQGGSQQSFGGSQGRQQFASRNQGYSMNRSNMNPTQDSRFNGEERRNNKEGSPSRTAPSPAAPGGNAAPKDQRKVFAAKGREESELKKFGQDFRLQESTPETKKTSPATTPTAVEAAPALPSDPPAESAHPPPSVPEPSPPVQSTPATPAEVAVPPITKSEEELDKVSETLKKSNLNPNAKEFVFNPNAKVFTPRSPSSATPPRSHTPQAPPGAQLLIPAPMAPAPNTFQAAGGAGHHPVMVPTLVYPNYMPGNPAAPIPAPLHGALPNQQFNNHNPGNPRFRKSIPGMTHRPELTSPMQVAAATGQPLLAPGPLPTPPFLYQPQGSLVPNTHQSYSPMYTFRVMAPQGLNPPPSVSYQEANANGVGPMFASPNIGHTQTSNAQPGMALHQHHPSTSSSPAQHQPIPQGTPTPTGTPQQVMYQPGNLPHGQGQPMPVVIIPSAHSQHPGSGVGNPQGVQIYPLGSSPAGMALTQYHLIQHPHGGQPSPMQQLVPHNNP